MFKHNRFFIFLFVFIILSSFLIFPVSAASPETGSIVVSSLQYGATSGESISFSFSDNVLSFSSDNSLGNGYYRLFFDFSGIDFESYPGSFSFDFVSVDRRLFSTVDNRFYIVGSSSGELIPVGTVSLISGDRYRIKINSDLIDSSFDSFCLRFQVINNSSTSFSFSFENIKINNFVYKYSVFLTSIFSFFSTIFTFVSSILSFIISSPALLFTFFVFISLFILYLYYRLSRS